MCIKAGHRRNLLTIITHACAYFGLQRYEKRARKTSLLDFYCSERQVPSPKAQVRKGERRRDMKASVATTAGLSAQRSEVYLIFIAASAKYLRQIYFMHLQESTRTYTCFFF